MLLIIVALIVVLVVVSVVKAVQIIPQATAAVIERLGRFKGTADPGLAFLVPFIDKVRERIDLREQVVSFPPQPVITQDNLTVNIDTVVYYQVTDPKSAVYEISDYIVGVEQITTTTLRNVVGGMSLEDTLTSRDEINTVLRGELDEATGRWGIRVARVEIKAIDPPASIQESMERQMKADREKRAMILTAEGQRESAIRSAEGQKQSQILTAEGAKQAAILNAEADRQSRILRAQGDRAARYLEAQGQAKAIEKVFAAIKAGRPTPELLAYQYLQTLPQMAQGEANKVWLVPSDFGKALEGFTRMLGRARRGRGVPLRAVAGRRRGGRLAAGGRRRADQGLVRHGGRPGDRQGRAPTPRRRPARRCRRSARRPSAARDPAAPAATRAPVGRRPTARGTPRSAAADAGRAGSPESALPTPPRGIPQAPAGTTAHRARLPQPAAELSRAAAAVQAQREAEGQLEAVPAQQLGVGEQLARSARRRPPRRRRAPRCAGTAAARRAGRG